MDNKLSRFTGTVAELMAIDVSSIASWIASIPFSEWHQQHPTRKNQLRPAMMTDLSWHGFGGATQNAIDDVMLLFPGCSESQRMLSVVMPSDTIPTHVDEQNARWICRVHIPILADHNSIFIVDGKSYTLEPGLVYLVNTLRQHGVENTGSAPRIHLMFDVIST